MTTKLGSRPGRRAHAVMPVTWLAHLTALSCALALLTVALPARPARAQSLRPTPASLDRQNAQAHRQRFSYLETPAQVRRFVDLGYLVPIPGNRDYTVKEGIQFAYARPAVKTFLERFSRRFHDVCGEQMVVTSLTRPRSLRLHNSSVRSVHPTGMAVDIRLPWSRSCRGWVEGVLYSLEAEGLLEANREHHPPHYHVAVFPDPYLAYVARVERGDAPREDQIRPAVRPYRVQRGDTLWRIAHRHGVSVDKIKAVNAMGSDRIRPGQVLDIPAS